MAAAVEKTNTVVVVGSGLSGLTTAYRLLQKSQESNVIILEANDYIGGRTRSLKLKGGELVSVGGTWAIFEDKFTLGLASDVDCLPFAPDLKLQYLAPQFYKPTGFFLMIKLWLLGKAICKTDDWWTFPKAKKYDRLSLEEWMNKPKYVLHSKSRSAVREWFIVMETFPDISSISTFFAAICVYKRLSNISKTGILIPRALRWDNGTGVFVDAIVEKIKHLGGEFKTNSPVTSVVHTPDYSKVHVTTLSGQTYEADYVVMAGSPNSQAAIRFKPTLPEDLSNLNQSLVGTNNPAYNVVLAWKTPWWRKKNLGSQILPDWFDPFPKHGSGVFGPVMELTPRTEGARGILRILTTPELVEGLSDEQIKQSAINFLKKYYPDDVYNELEAVDEVLLLNWQDQQPYIQGVTYHWGVGALSLYGEHLRKSWNRVYFAGSERAVGGLHWMEGAIQRGTVVATELLHNFDKGFAEDLYKEASQHADDIVTRIRKDNKIEDKFPKVVSEFLKGDWYALLAGTNNPKESKVYQRLRDWVDVPKTSIAIIGAGLTGASLAYWLHQDLDERLEITVYERSDKVGGRITESQIAGKLIEQGAEVGIADYQLFNSLIRDFNLETVPPYGVSRMGLWDGKAFVFEQDGSNILTALKAIFRYGIYSPSKVVALRARFMNKFREIYNLIDERTYIDFGDIIKEVGLYDLTGITTQKYFSDEHINKRYIDELAAATIRAFAKQNPSNYTALNGVSAQVTDLSSLFAVQGGNVQVVERCLQSSHAALSLNTTIKKIEKHASEGSDPKYTIHGVNSEGVEFTKTFDIVILATPHEVTGIEFVNVTMPPSREFAEIYQLWLVGKPRASYFHKKHSKDVPKTVLTSLAAGEDGLFDAIMYYGDVALENGDTWGVFKFFSSHPISDSDAAKAFELAPGVPTQSITWKNAFPKSIPTQPKSGFIIDHGFYYPNSQETYFPTMESSLIASKNVANLVLEKLRGYFTQSRVLKISVASASNLQKKDLVSASDPYAIVQYNKKEYKTRYIKDNLNPVWNETALFELDANWQNTSVTVVLKDKDPWYERDDYLGTATFPLASITPNELAKSVTVPLETQGTLTLYISVIIKSDVTNQAPVAAEAVPEEDKPLPSEELEEIKKELASRDEDTLRETAAGLDLPNVGSKDEIAQVIAHHIAHRPRKFIKQTSIGQFHFQHTEHQPHHDKKKKKH